MLVFNIIRSHKYFPFPRISRDFPGFPVISRDFPGFPFPGISRETGFPVSRDFPFPGTSRFPGLPVSRDFPFPGISRFSEFPVSRDSQWNSNMAHCVLLWKKGSKVCLYGTCKPLQCTPGKSLCNYSYLNSLILKFNFVPKPVDLWLCRAFSTKIIVWIVAMPKINLQSLKL